MIRNDFVSNSSSSSFILAGDEDTIFGKVNLTKKDFIDAIKSLTGHNELNKQYCQILDKEIQEDKDIINSNYVDWLKSWTTPFIAKWDDDYEFYPATDLLEEDGYTEVDTTYRIGIPGAHIKKWENFYDVLRDIAFKDGYLPYHWDPSITTYSYYNKETDKWSEHEIDKTIYDMLCKIYKEIGIATNHDVLLSDYGRMLIHFGDNCVYDMTGMTDPSKNEPLSVVDNDYAKENNEKIKNSIWKTESYSMFRFCEVLFKWFVDNGRIKPDSGLNWTVIADSIIGCTMHEG